MRQVKLSRLYDLVAVVCVFALATDGAPFCSSPSSQYGYKEQKTLCDNELCNCHDPYGKVQCSCSKQALLTELIVRSTGPCMVPPQTSTLSISDCDNVTVIEDGLKGLDRLRNLELSNVKELTLQSRAFHWEGPPGPESGLRIRLTNVTVPDVPSYAFTGRIDAISLNDCYVGMIRSFAFSSSSRSDKVEFERCNVSNVEAQAFKKFTVKKFLLSNSRFNVIPSRFLADVDVEDSFRIESTFVDVVRTLGFKVRSPEKTILSNSHVNRVESEAFKMRTRGDVSVQNNVFGTIDAEAFRGVSVEKYIIQQAGKQKFKFENNSVSEFGEKSFLFNETAFEVLISRLMIDEVCSCDRLETWKDLFKEKQMEPFWCHEDDRSELNVDHVSGKSFYESYCTTLISSIYFFVIIITSTAVSLVVLILLIVIYVRHRKKWNSVPTRDVQKEKQRPKAKKNNVPEIIKPESAKAIIVPDGRTYRETEFHVIVEKAEPLDEGYIPYRVTRDRSHSQLD